MKLQADGKTMTLAKFIEVNLKHGASLDELRVDELAALAPGASLTYESGSVVTHVAPKQKKQRAPSRSERWSTAASDASDALARLREVQEDFESWRDNLPENLQSSAVGEKLDTICDLDIEGAISTIDDASNAELPQGFGRD